MSTTEVAKTEDASQELPSPTSPTSPAEAPAAPAFVKGTAFWMSYTAILVSTLLSALDLTGVATALPTITAELHGGGEFVWVGSAYALSSTAFLPLSGCLANIFGRRPVMMGSIAFFALGSALSGAAQNMNMLIAARTIQGIGGGAIINLTDILISDMVPLAERGLYQGFLAMTYAFASGIGPPIGGALAQRASWRWLFYLNLPLAGIAFVLVMFFLRVRTPEGSIVEKLKRVDWLGNLIVIVGTTLAIIGLTFAGSKFPWASAQVLTPLIVGLVFIGLFLWYEAKVPREPTIPWEIMTNRTALSAYVSVFTHGITGIAVLFFMPVYFQACLDASPIRSGVDMFPSVMVIPTFAVVGGGVVQAMKKYRPANVIGWVLSIIGFGVLSLLKANSPTGNWVGFQIVVAAGTGFLFPATVFPILAPTAIEHSGSALAFLAFTRAFAQTWGITICSTILQNELSKRLPASFVDQVFASTGESGTASQLTYSAIPLIRHLAEPVKTQVRVAFADSMSVMWKTMIGISGIGIISLFFLKEIPMGVVTDENFGLEDKKEKKAEDVEKEVSSHSSSA